MISPVGCMLAILYTNVEGAQFGSGTDSDTNTSNAVFACCNSANEGTQIVNAAWNRVCTMTGDTGFDAVGACATKAEAVCVAS